MNIGLIGGLGSGKTTIANYLFKQYGYCKMSLADPMRDIAKNIFDIHDKTDPRYRVLMQKLGTDWFRSFDPDVWVKYLKRRIDKADWEYPGIVVDDVRFINEAITLLDWGWSLIYIDCPVEIRKERCLKRDGNFNEESLKHISELEVEQIRKELSSRLNIIDGTISIDKIPDQVKKILELVK
jgi:dephospho-CoA kinase